MDQHAIYLLEKIYDKYGPVVYGIAIQIAPTRATAEQVLISTFQRAHEQNIPKQDYPLLVIELIKLTLKTARQLLKPDELKNNFRIKQFENTPLFNQFLCEDMSVESCCMKNNLTRKEVITGLCKEFMLLKNYDQDLKAKIISGGATGDIKSLKLFGEGFFI
jgi:hypothetical protein